MIVFVTGAAGFLGKAVVDQLLECGHGVVALVRTVPTGEHHPNLAFVRGDVRRSEGWKGELARVDAVIHLAASFDDLHTQLSVNVLGTERVLQAMTEAGCRRLVHVSTFSLYDYDARPAGTTVDERFPVEQVPVNRDAYAETKLYQEQMVRRFAAEGNDVTIVRPGAIFGPGRWWDGGAAVGVKGRVWLGIAPQAKPKLVSVWNCADAIVACLESSAARGETFNIVDDDLPSQKQFFAWLKEAGLQQGVSIPVPYAAASAVAGMIAWVNKRRYGGRALVPYFVDRSRMTPSFKPFEYSNAHIKSVIGWKPRLSVRDAITKGAQLERAGS